MPTPESFRAFEAPPRAVTTFAPADLPPDGALVEVAWSSVNYKDGLAASPNGRVARISPIVPGIDLSGTLVEDTADLPAGTQVVAHGYEIGVSRHGGFAEYARVPPEWLVPLPSGLDVREAMVIGTAGFTAAMAVIALEHHGVAPSGGPVLVTGASGGVGSVAVAILGRRGYTVVASSGKSTASDYLHRLGATEVIARDTLMQPGKPLEAMTWGAAVDCVGGVTLANVLARIGYGGAVAATGLTGGADLPATVMPFILRGVSLLGIDSVQTPIEQRRAIWERLGGDLKPPGLDDIAHEVGLGELDGVLSSVLEGGLTGRTIVDVHR